MRRLPGWLDKGGGLEFGCTRCGRCCTGAPGYVWVGADEIERLARFLGLGRDQFGRRYLRRVDGGLSLVEMANGDCVFFRPEVGCTVYPARPIQCRTYPFWAEIVRSRAAWLREGRSCAGIAGGGPKHAPEAIRRCLEMDERGSGTGTEGEREG